MKKIFLFIFMIAMNSFVSLAQGESSAILPLEDVEGKWYINQTNFPMWLKGDKTSPTFNYTIATKKGKLGLKDKVTYTKSGKQKSIVGFDTPTNDINTAFVWKGKGLMGVLKSRWEILYLDQEENWGIIHFEKTLFTPKGYDVISKDKVLSPQVQENIKAVLKALKIEDVLITIPQT